jgi:uncharacterized protein
MNMQPTPRAVTWLNPKIEVRESVIEGRGLFAVNRIEPGETIIEMGGMVLPEEAFRSFTERTPKYSAVTVDEGLHLVLDTPNAAEFGNHSCDANTWMRDSTTTEAKRAIAPGEEVTIDYATHSGLGDWRMTCHCGATNCRRTIRGDDWQRRDVQDQNRGHFTPFLHRRIERARRNED